MYAQASGPSKWLSHNDPKYHNMPTHSLPIRLSINTPPFSHSTIPHGRNIVNAWLGHSQSTTVEDHTLTFSSNHHQTIVHLSFNSHETFSDFKSSSDRFHLFRGYVYGTLPTGTQAEANTSDCEQWSHDSLEVCRKIQKLFLTPIFLTSTQHQRNDCDEFKNYMKISSLPQCVHILRFVLPLQR